MHSHTIRSLYLNYRKLYAKLSFSLHHCLLCHCTSDKQICQNCLADFFHQSTASCSRCALPLPIETIDHQKERICGECLALTGRQPSRFNTRHYRYFDTTEAVYLYRGALPSVLKQFKEQRNFTAGKILAELFCLHITEKYHNSNTAPDLLIPVPLHWRQRWRRGFNQSSWFAKHLSQKLMIPYRDGFSRAGKVTTQKKLSRSQRLHLPNNTFTTTMNLKDLHIAIIDDVMTTGATANAMAVAAKRAGAKHVSIWVLARTPKSLTQNNEQSV